jgi:Acyl-CoA carboxylase epsilon subunit
MTIEPEPAFAVVAGQPDDTEVAALTSVLYLCSRLHRPATPEPRAGSTTWTRGRRHVGPAAWAAADDRHLA